MSMSSMCTGRLLMAVAATAVGILVAAPTMATALSCASHPDASPGAIARGTEQLAVQGTFQEHYDGAIFGTVVSMNTQDDGEQPDYGRTAVVVEVTGSLGPELGSTTVIVEEDPGWLNGYAFELGTHYFIPYVQSEKGLYSHLCDPIAEVDPTDVPELLELAEQNAWPPGIDSKHDPSEQAVADTDDAPPAEAAAESAAWSRSDTNWVSALVGLLAAAAAAGLWARKRRRSEARSIRG